MIDGNTKLISLIGNPVKHTLSPKLHNMLFKTFDLNYIYNAFRVDTEKLKDVINGVRAFGIEGLNVTIPYKENIIKYLDKVDSSALNIGSVNTIRNIDGELFGYNTDYIGFINSLKRANIDYNSKNIAILGFGGASNAILYGLLNSNAVCHIFVRDILKAESKLHRSYFTNKNVKLFLISDFSEKSSEYDIIINTTPVGMGESLCESPVNLLGAKSSCAIVDIIYNPYQTKFLKQAESLNLKYINGMSMLIEQALESFRIWTDIKVEDDELIKKIYNEFIYR